MVNGGTDNARMMTSRVLALALLLFIPASGLAQAPKQAVIDTSAGTIVLDLLADRAPNHVALFIKTASAGGYDGTTFFRMIKFGIIQGGDPVTRDPAARGKYGTGGLNLLKPEITDEKHTRGAVSATQVPGKPDSAGTQFFISVSDQPGLDGKYTIFARVNEGMLVAQKISETAVDAAGLAVDRVVVNKVTIRDKPADVPEPFSTEPLEELARYRAVLETSMGDITLSFTPDKAPNHVRNFLRLAQAGVYDGMSFHRVVKGFVIQSGHLPTRAAPLGETQQRVRAADEGGVQRSAAREGDAVDGAAGRARLGEHVVLHRHGKGRRARRQVHGVRSGRERLRRRREDRGRGVERRGAGGAGRAQEGDGR